MNIKQKWKISAVNLTLLICSVVISLVLVEFLIGPALLGFTIGLPRSIALLGFAAMPNTKVDDVLVNSQGFTGQILELPERKVSAARILTLGGSAFFNRRMTYRLIDAFSKVAPIKVKVTGGALRAHSSRSSMIKYDSYFGNYHFDYVLIYHGINDLWMNYVSPENYCEDYSHRGPWYRRNIFLNNSITARYI